MAFTSTARLALCASALCLAAAAATVDSCAANDPDCEVAAVSSVELLQSSSSWVQEWLHQALLGFSEEDNEEKVSTGTAAVENWGEAARESVRTCISTYADGLNSLKEGLGEGIRAHHLKPVRVSRRHITINAGSGTTATRSLNVALAMLNMTGIHWAPNNPWEKFILTTLGLVNCDVLCRQTRQTEKDKKQCRWQLQSFDFTALPNSVDHLTDTPIAEVFIDLFLAFPRAKWLLTTRDPVEWAKARKGAQATSSFAPMQEPCGEFITSYNISTLARMLELQDDLVRCVVPRERLLEFSVFTDPPERIDNLMTELSQFVDRPLSAPMKFPTVSS